MCISVYFTHPWQQAFDFFLQSKFSTNIWYAWDSNATDLITIDKEIHGVKRNFKIEKILNLSSFCSLLHQVPSKMSFSKMMNLESETARFDRNYFSWSAEQKMWSAEQKFWSVLVRKHFWSVNFWSAEQKFWSAE